MTFLDISISFHHFHHFHQFLVRIRVSIFSDFLKWKSIFRVEGGFYGTSWEYIDERSGFVNCRPPKLLLQISRFLDSGDPWFCSVVHITSDDGRGKVEGRDLAPFYHAWGSFVCKLSVFQGRFNLQSAVFHHNGYILLKSWISWFSALILQYLTYEMVQYWYSTFSFNRVSKS